MGQGIIFDLTDSEKNPEGWTKQCVECGEDFTALAKHAKYCSSGHYEACKETHHRNMHKLQKV